MGVMTHIAPPVYSCVVTPIITRAALCVIIFFGVALILLMFQLNLATFRSIRNDKSQFYAIFRNYQYPPTNPAAIQIP